jgi:hypothetical protein
MCRLLLATVVSATVLVSTASGSAAQDVSVADPAGAGEAYTENLAFSRDGRALREVRRVVLEDADRFWRVRAITYVAATGAISHELNLQPYTEFFSATTDGRIAIISVDTDRPEERVNPFLLDTETGRTQKIPSNWFDPDDPRPFVAISGDGRLVSVFTESGRPGDLLVVTLYDWRTKKLVATQMSGFFSAGGIFGGGVTKDGKIEFWNNRVGGNVVDPKTGRLLVSVGPNSHRSLDGAWVVEFPNPMFVDGPREVIIKNGSSGEVVGKLDLQITDDGMENWWGRGVFCGTSRRFIAATHDTVRAFEIPSGKKIADFPSTTWQDPNAMKTDPTVTVACSLSGKRVAIRSGVRLTLHDLN